MCVWVYMCVCVCLSAFVLHAVCVKKGCFLVGNRRSVAGNFDALTATLRESHMKELELEECHLKLKEEKLKFECEKWLQQQQKTGEGHSNRQYEVQSMDSPRAQQVGAHQTLQPMLVFANDDRQQDTIGLDERVLDPSEY